MSIKKQFLKSKPVCKVVFRLDATEANGAKKVQVLGDFNNWDQTAEPLTQLKSNDFSATLELESGKEYQFRYLIDGSNWKYFSFLLPEIFVYGNWYLFTTSGLSFRFPFCALGEYGQFLHPFEQQ